jgi:hypothetical protein
MVKRSWLALVRLALAAATATGMVIAGQAAAAERKAILVFDFSAGMAAGFGGAAKSVTLRELMPEAASKLDPALQLGALVYGQRPRSGCTNISTLVPVGTLDPSALVTRIGAMRAHRSRSPLTDAINAGVTTAGTEPADILAVIGGAESCNKDLCAFAEALAGSRPDVHVSVIGIGLDEPTTAAIQCISALTGGTYTPAADREALALALQSGFSRLGKGTSSPTEAPPAPPELQLSLTLAAEKPALAVPIDWQITRVAQGAPGTVVYRGQEPQPKLALEAGRYQVRATLDRAVGEIDVDVAPVGPTAVALALNAGIVTVQSSVLSTPGEQPAMMVLSRERAGAGTSAETLLMEPVRNQRLVLPAGAYNLVVEKGLVRTEQRLVIEPGSELSQSTDITAGTLSVALNGATAQSSADGTRIVVSEAEPSATNGQREVARSGAQQPSFTLPPGRYTISAAQGNARTELDVTVRAGEIVRVPVSLSVGEIIVSTALPDWPSALTETLREQIWIELWQRAGDTPTLIERTSRAQFNKALAPGSYRIDLGIGVGPARLQQAFDVVAGQPTTLALNPELGVVTLRQANARDVQWEVRDASGAVLFDVARPEPQLALAPGTYQAVARWRGKTKTTPFVVTAGDINTVEVAPE